MLCKYFEPLSPLVLEYLKDVASKHEIMCLAEHKQCKQDLATAQKKFIDMGHKSWWTQAQRTAGGKSGGTSVHTKKCFKGHRLDWADLPEGQLLHFDPDMWTGTVIHGAINFVVISANF